PVIDPFSVDGVRQLAVRHDDARRRIKFERREQEALNAPVFTSKSPEVLAARGNIAKGLRVETVPEKKQENKLKITDTSQITNMRRSDGLPQPLAQSERLNELASRAEQGDKSARREMRQLMPQEQREGQQAGAVQQQDQQEQLRQQMKQKSKAERNTQTTPPNQQPSTPPPQQAAQNAQQQAKQQRKAEAQQQTAAAAQRAQQQQQTKQQRRLERQQQSAAQQAQQQMKQQRRAERQKQAPPATQ